LTFLELSSCQNDGVASGRKNGSGGATGIVAAHSRRAIDDRQKPKRHPYFK